MFLAYFTVNILQALQGDQSKIQHFQHDSASF
jgi:hypothetical protein